MKTPQVADREVRHVTRQIARALPCYGRGKSALQVTALCIAIMLALLAGTAFAQSNAANSGAKQLTPANSPKVIESYGKLPLSFEANQGQAAAPVKFVSRGNGYSLSLTRDKAVLALHHAEAANAPGHAIAPHELVPAAATPKPAPAKDAVLSMTVAGANATANTTGLNELPGKSNYFIGNDPAKWHTNVPTFAKVKYENIYRGIDLIYYGNQQQLEYDFVLAPGADPNQIKLAIDGGKLKIDADGSVVVKAGESEVRFQKPEVYQLTPDNQRTPVEGHYKLAAHNQVQFETGAYDKTKALVIDPVLVYSTYLAGSLVSNTSGIAVDSTGSAYVVGSTFAPDFPITPGAFSSTDVTGFVTKFDPTGTALVFSTFLGGTSGNGPAAIAVDAAGNVYITGTTGSTDFPTTPGAFQVHPGGGNDVFVTKLNPTGTALVYSSYLGGAYDESGAGIAVDGLGEAYVTGKALKGFPTTPGAFANSLKCGINFNPGIFVTKINATGSKKAYSTFLGCSDTDVPSSIALDASGNAYIGGATNFCNFPTTASAFQATCPSPWGGAFLSKLNTTGSAIIYSTYLGGSHGAEVHSIAVDAAGNAYVTGSTISNDFPTTDGAFQTTCGNPVIPRTRAFVTKFNSDGSAPAYSTCLGGKSDGYLQDIGESIALDSTGKAYVAGFTSSNDFPTVDPLQPSCADGSYCHIQADAFVSVVNPTGSALVYSTYLGGNNWDSVSGIALDPANNVYVTGLTYSPDFPATVGAFQTQATAGGAFVAKISATDAPGVALTPGSLTFPTQIAGTPGTSQIAYLRDAGSTNLELQIDVTPGDFAQSNNCGNVLTPGRECKITVTFNPDTPSGPKTASVTITDNAAGSPHNLLLTGTALPRQPAVKLQPASLTFWPQTVGTTSGPYETGLYNVGSEPLTIYGTQLSGTNMANFTVVDDIRFPCPKPPATLAPGSECLYGVLFTPPVIGTFTAALTISDDAADSPQTVPLSGVGVGISQGIALNPFHIPPRIYGSKPLVITAISSSGLPVTLSIASGPATIQGNVVTPTGAGVVTILASQPGNDQYLPASLQTSFTVIPAWLSVSAVPATIRYGVAVPTLQYHFSGFVNGDTAAVISGTPDEETTAVQGSPVGKYPITISQGTLSSDKYRFTFGSRAEVTILPANLTVRPNAASAIYGSPLPALGYTITGFVNGDTSAVVSGAPVLATTATQGSPVATYPITATLGTLSATNYSFLFAPGHLAIRKAQLNVAADNKTVPYGQPFPPLTYTVTGFVNGDTSSVITGAPTLGVKGAAPGSPPGQYEIGVDASQMTAANYFFHAVNGVLTIQ